jgi:hypothetical protein
MISRVIVSCTADRVKFIVVVSVAQVKWVCKASAEGELSFAEAEAQYSRID